MDRIQGSLGSHDLTLTDIKNYRRCGRSHKDGNPTPDTIFCSNFGKKKLPDLKRRYTDNRDKDNPYIYKPTVEVSAPKKYRNWSVQEVYKDLKEKNNE